MPKKEFVVVSSLFPGAFKFGQQILSETSLNLEDIYWINPNFSTKFIKQLFGDVNHLLTPVDCPLSHKEAELFFKSLEDVKSHSNYDYKQLLALELMTDNKKNDEKEEISLLEDFVNSADGTVNQNQAQLKNQETQDIEASFSVLDKAQRFLILSCFLEKTQHDIKKIIEYITEARQKVDSAIGALELMTLSDEPSLKNEAKQNLDELHQMAEKLPDTQDFYGMINTPETGEDNKPEWKILLSNLLAFVSDSACLIIQDDNFVSYLKETGLWDTSLVDSKQLELEEGVSVPEVLYTLASSVSILKLSLVDLFKVNNAINTNRWLNNKRVFIVLG